MRTQSQLQFLEKSKWSSGQFVDEIERLTTNSLYILYMYLPEKVVEQSKNTSFHQELIDSQAYSHTTLNYIFQAIFYCYNFYQHFQSNVKIVPFFYLSCCRSIFDRFKQQFHFIYLYMFDKFLQFAIIKAMELEINQIDFTIAINTFHDDSLGKIQYLTKLQLDFLRKFESRVNFPQYHSQMIFQIRKIVNIIEEVFRDVHDYFYDLKIGFAYELIRKIQTLMVIGYNHLSQALLITFDIYERQKNKQPQVNTCTCNGKNAKKNFVMSKDQLKKIQHIDYTISSIQSQQQRLAIQMQTMYDRMLLQKGMIDKIKPSLVMRQLQQIKDHFENVMQQNQKIFQQNFMMQFFQLHNQIKKIDKPQQINELYKKINSNLKDNFVKHIIKTAGKINQERKKINYNKNCVEIQTMDLILPKAKPKKDNSNSNSVHNSILKTSSFNTNTNINGKDKKNILQKSSFQASQHKKIVESLNNEIQLLKQQNKKEVLNFNNLQNNYDTMQTIYQKVRGQLEMLKTQRSSKIQKLTSQNKQLKSQLIKSNFYTPKQTLAIQTDQFQNTQTQQTQTYEQFSIPDKENQIIKLLKTRNQKAIVMINEKDKKIRQFNNQNHALVEESKMFKAEFGKFVQAAKTQFQLNLIESNGLEKANALVIGKVFQQILYKLKQCKSKFQLKTKGQKRSQYKIQARTSLLSQTEINQINQNQQYQEDSQSFNLKTEQSEKSIFDTVSQYMSIQDRKKRRISAINIFNTNRFGGSIKGLVDKNQKQTQTQLVMLKNGGGGKLQQDLRFSNSEQNLTFNGVKRNQMQTALNLNKKQPVKLKKHRKYVSNLDKNQISFGQAQNQNENSELYLHSLNNRNSKFKKINISNQSSQKCRKVNIKDENILSNMKLKLPKQVRQEGQTQNLKSRLSSRFSMLKKQLNVIKKEDLDQNIDKNSQRNIQTHRKMNSTVGGYFFESLKMDFSKNKKSNFQNACTFKNKISSDNKESQKAESSIFSMARQLAKNYQNFEKNDPRQYPANIQLYSNIQKNRSSQNENGVMRKTTTQNIKKRSLLLSIQKYKQSNESILIKQLLKLLERYGKDKIYECYQKITKKEQKLTASQINSIDFMEAI